MKVIKFYAGEYFYAVAALTDEEAEAYLFECAGEMDIDKAEEIPESDWDEKIIEMYEDNDTESAQFFVSIREEICGTHPQLIFTNDISLID